MTLSRPVVLSVCLSVCLSVSRRSVFFSFGRQLELSAMALWADVQGGLPATFALEGSFLPLSRLAHEPATRSPIQRPRAPRGANGEILFGKAKPAPHARHGQPWLLAGSTAPPYPTHCNGLSATSCLRRNQDEVPTAV